MVEGASMAYFVEGADPRSASEAKARADKRMCFIVAVWIGRWSKTQVKHKTREDKMMCFVASWIGGFNIVNAVEGASEASDNSGQENVFCISGFDWRVSRS